MKYLGLASVLVLTMSLGMLISQAGAKSPKQEELALQKQEKQEALALKKQEKQEALALKHSGNYVGSYDGANSNRSVPVPGTLLLFGGVFAGLVWWRERQARA